MRLLVVDRCIVSELAKVLDTSYSIDFARNGRDGIYLTEINSYDLIILDLDLPDIDGIEVCRLLRSINRKVPILILTQKDTITDKVYSLDSGADDYLTKPFSTPELLARIRALSRRNFSSVTFSKVKVGNLCIDIENKIVERGGKVIKLRKKEFDILEYLVRNKGITISKDKLIQHIWGYEREISENAVEVHVCKLREKINRGFKKGIIKTIYGFGYKLEG